MARIAQQLLATAGQSGAGVHPGATGGLDQSLLRAGNHAEVLAHAIGTRVARHRWITGTHLGIPSAQCRMGSLVGGVVQDSIEGRLISTVVDQHVVERGQPIGAISARCRPLVDQHVGGHRPVAGLLAQEAVQNGITAIQLVLIDRSRHRIQVGALTGSGIERGATGQHLQFVATHPAVELIVLGKGDLETALTTLVQQAEAVVDILAGAHEEVVPAAALGDVAVGLIDQRIADDTLVGQRGAIGTLDLNSARNRRTIETLADVSNAGIVVHIGDANEDIGTAANLRSGHSGIGGHVANGFTAAILLTADRVIGQATEGAGLTPQGFVSHEGEIGEIEAERLVELCAVPNGRNICERPEAVRQTCSIANDRISCAGNSPTGCAEINPTGCAENSGCSVLNGNRLSQGRSLGRQEAWQCIGHGLLSGQQARLSGDGLRGRLHRHCFRRCRIRRRGHGSHRTVRRNGGGLHSSSGLADRRFHLQLLRVHRQQRRVGIQCRTQSRVGLRHRLQGSSRLIRHRFHGQQRRLCL